MSILVDRDILAARERGEIIIEPWDSGALGTNSYDVHLAPLLKVYARGAILDCRRANPTVERVIHEIDGYILYPDELYLASTIEYTETHKHVPILNGKSSLGRLGLSIHITAGTGDVGFCNHWTLEMTVVRPLRIYAGMAIGQLLYFTASSEPLVPYGTKTSAKYTTRDALPGASQMHLNFAKEK